MNNTQIFHDAQSGPNPHNAEAANRTLQILDIAQSPNAYKLGPEFEQLVSEIVNGVAIALACTHQPEHGILLLLDIVRSIERFATKRLSRTGLHRQLKRRSDQRKIAKCRGAFRRQLVIFGIPLDTNIEEQFSRIQMALERNSSTTQVSDQKPTVHGTEYFDNTAKGGVSQDPPLPANSSQENEDKPTIQLPLPTGPSNPREQRLPGPATELHARPPRAIEQRDVGVHALPHRNFVGTTDDDRPLSPDLHPPRYAQSADHSPPLHAAESQPESTTPAATPPTSSTSGSPALLLSQILQSASLSAPVIVFFIEHFHADFTTHTANHGSGNVTTTTVAHSANDSSAHWSA